MGKRGGLNLSFRRLTQSMTLAWAIVVATASGCGPESPLVALESNCRQVCRFGHAQCYGQGIMTSSVETCTDDCTTEKLDAAIALGYRCDEDYAELLACAATWTCMEFLDFDAKSNQPCGLEWNAFDEKCPGILFHMGESS